MARKRINANQSSSTNDPPQAASNQSSSRSTALQNNNNNNDSSSHSIGPVASGSGSGSSTPTSDSASDSWIDKDGKPQHLPKKIVLERTNLKRPSLAGSKGFGGSNVGLGRSASYKLKAPGTPFDELDLSEVPWLVGEGE